MRSIPYFGEDFFLSMRRGGFSSHKLWNYKPVGCVAFHPKSYWAARWRTMKMPEVWYTSVGPTERLTQGDIIVDCPLVGWKAEIGGIVGAEETEVLKQAVDAFIADTIVMTQACDLEHDKVANVVLCPHYPLAGYRADWESAMKSRNQNPTDRSWRRHCEDISEGLVWNLAILNLLTDGPLTTEHRIVHFHEVFTVPRAFLETLMIGRNRHRLRLLPPYREHLSQAFARFFMRVGLPVPVTTGW